MWLIAFIVLVLLAVGFIGGILIGRRNRVKVENAVTRAKEEYQEYKERRG